MNFLGIFRFFDFSLLYAFGRYLLTSALKYNSGAGVQGWRSGEGTKKGIGPSSMAGRREH